MRKEEIALELYNSAKENGFLDTIYEVIGPKVSVSIAFTKKACDTNIDDIEFSVRANNALKRAGYFKIDDIVAALSNETLIHIRNLGKKTFNEIQTKVLVFGYEHLTEKEKIQFSEQLFFKKICNKHNSKRMRYRDYCYFKIFLEYPKSDEAKSSASIFSTPLPLSSSLLMMLAAR